MSKEQKVIITLSLLLAAALCVIWWQWHAAATATDAADASTAVASERAAATRELAALKSRHADDLAALRASLEATVAARVAILDERTRSAKAARLAATKLAATSPQALASAVAAAIPASAQDVYASATTLTLTAPAALRWLDLTLRLRADLDLCADQCAVRLAAQRRDIEPPLVAARYAAEEATLGATGAQRIAEARAQALEAEAKRAKMGQLWVGFGAGAAGLVVGAVAGAVLVWRR